jgi:hypothetical protein
VSYILRFCFIFFQWIILSIGWLGLWLGKRRSIVVFAKLLYYFLDWNFLLFLIYFEFIYLNTIITWDLIIWLAIIITWIAICQKLYILHWAQNFRIFIFIIICFLVALLCSCYIIWPKTLRNLKINLIVIHREILIFRCDEIFTYFIRSIY